MYKRQYVYHGIQNYTEYVSALFSNLERQCIAYPSIENMKNSVKVVTGTDKLYTVKAVAKDTDSIYTYSVLQDVFKIDEKDGDANTYAKNKLSELNKIKESFSIEIIEAVEKLSDTNKILQDEHSCSSFSMPIFRRWQL